METAFVEKIEPLNIYHWPKELLEKSIYTEFYHFTEENKQRLKQYMNKAMDLQPIRISDVYDIFQNIYTQHKNMIDEGCFIKFFNCAEDSITNINNHLKITNIKQIMSVFFESMTLLDNIYLCEDKPLILQLRRWINIPLRSEYRCFIREKKLIGVSQYFCNINFNFTPDEKQYLSENVKFFMEKSVIPYLNQQDVLIDISLDFNGIYNYLPAKTIIIDLNPFDERLRPCLFTWPELRSNWLSNSDFKNIRFVEKEYKPSKITTRVGNVFSLNLATSVHDNLLEL